MNERIKELRKSLKLSQTEFGKKLGVSRDVINNIENGRVELKEYLIKTICSVFNVSANWLRTGEGGMKAESDEDMLDRIARELSLTPLQSEAFHYLMSLPDEERETVAKAFFILLKGNKKPAGRKESCPPETEADVKRKIVNSELDAEAKGKTS